MKNSPNDETAAAIARIPAHGFFRTLLSQIYKEKRDRFLAKVFKKKTRKPFMKYRELQIVEEILTNLKPKACLEWGAGYSTFYFARYLAQDAKWTAVEHNVDWASRVAAMNHDARINICHVGPDSASWTDREQDGAYKEGTCADFESYIAFGSKFKRIDFILVDGRARKEALIKAQKLIGKKGVVVLHDANRAIYHQPFGLFKHQELFTDGRLDGGGIWIGSNGVNLNTVFNVALHKRLWQAYNIFRKNKQQTA